MPKNSHNQGSKKVSSQSDRKLGVDRSYPPGHESHFTFVSAHCQHSAKGREWACRVLGLVLMNSAYQAKLQDQDRAEGLLNDVFSVLSDKLQNLSSAGNVSVFDLLSKNQPFLDKMEKLRDYRAQLVLVKKGTPEYLATSIEALNILGEIIRENWNEFPVSVKENLKEKLNFNYFIRNALSSPIKTLLAIIKSFPLIPMAFSEKSEFLKLKKSHEKAIYNILSIGFEIRDYGHPLKFKDDRTKKQIQEQIKKNQAAMALIDSWRNEVLTPDEFELRAKSFQIMKEVIDDNRPDGGKVFSSL